MSGKQPEQPSRVLPMGGTDGEQRLLLALDAAGDGAWEWNIESGEMYFSRRWIEALGYESSQVPLRVEFWESIIHPDDRPHTKHLLSMHMAGRSERYRCENRLRLSSGEYRWNLQRGAVVERDAEGNALRMVGTDTNISDRKAAEEKLLQSEAKLQSEKAKLLRALRNVESTESKLRVLFDQSFYWTGILDLEGRLIDINQIALSAFGFTREMVIGKPFWETPWWGNQKRVQRKLERGFRQVINGGAYREELPYPGPAGDQRISDFIYTPGKDREGKLIFVVATGADVTSRYQAEESRRESEARLQLGIDVARVALGRVDYSTGRFELSEQAARMYGLGEKATTCTREELHATFHPEDRPWLCESIAKYLLPDGDGRMACEHRIVLPDGGTRWLEVRKQAFFDRSGESFSPIYGILAARDITDQKQIERHLIKAKQQAEESNRSKSEFLANMSHEIRTPMTAILGYTDLVLEKVSDPEVVSSLETIQRNGKFLIEIINDILDLSKIEAGKLEIRRERFDPQKLIDDVVSIMNVRAMEKGLELSVSTDPNLPGTIVNDSKRLKQIVVNLLGNAIKFTKEGGVHLEIGFLEQCGDLLPKNVNGAVSIEVKDTGIGLSRPQQRKLFQPFVQGDSRINRDFGGTGLGLAISQRLAGMLGGRIDCESTLSVGSNFTCLVDAGKWRSQAAEEQNRSETPTVREADVVFDQIDSHVLVVDDRSDIRFLTKRLLTRVGATVTEAVDGIEALEMIEQMNQSVQPFDVIILDMQMPRLDGYRVAAELRASGFTKPIIALTAEAMEGDSNRCLASGCDDYVSKPIDAKHFVRLVHHYATKQ